MVVQFTIPKIEGSFAGHSQAACTCRRQGEASKLSWWSISFWHKHQHLGEQLACSAHSVNAICSFIVVYSTGHTIHAATFCVINRYIYVFSLRGGLRRSLSFTSISTNLCFFENKTKHPSEEKQENLCWGKRPMKWGLGDSCSTG